MRPSAPHVTSTLRRAVRSIRRRLGGSPDAAPDRFADATFPASPWDPLPDPGTAAVTCNLCHWHGAAFEGPAHSEFAVCPSCGSVARDRFLIWALQRRVPPCLGARVLETSPRMGASYRRAMARWFDYRASDFDLRAHQGDLQIDLQDIALGDDSLDVVLSAHVLEHVPDTDRALAELARVITPGGWLVLQVPVPHGETAPPTEPEFHGDDTPVFWRFGPDLTDRLGQAGFDATLYATAEMVEAADRGRTDLPCPGEVDGPAVVVALGHHRAEPIASVEQADRHGFVPALHFFTWVGRRR